MATPIPDEGLYVFQERAKGQVVLITGAANGLGKAAAKELARRGAKVVIGDIDIKGGAEVVADIRSFGGDAIFQRCNVLDYEDQLSLFQLAKSSYGEIDVVIPNAGVAESDQIYSIKLDENGRPRKPSLKTLEINLMAVTYTAQLAYYFLNQNKKEGSLKTLVFVGSMASFSKLPLAAMYTTSKHAILGLMRSTAVELKPRGIRVCAVCPWFADTEILPFAFKAFLAGIPMVPISRVAGAMFLAATDGTEDTHGACYTLPDDGEVFRIPLADISEGVYAMLDARTKRALGAGQSLRNLFAFLELCFRSPGFKVFFISVFAYVFALVFDLI